MKVLICIASHYVPDRIKYLNAVLENISTYQWDIDVIVDSNTLIPDLPEWVTNVVHHNLEHPFHLTLMHREHFKRNIDNYDWFCYIEDDMLIKWEAFKAYTEKFASLWPSCVPSFIRIEQKEGVEYISDVTHQHPANLTFVNGKPYFSLPFPQHYHGFYIAPAYALKETITDSFTKLHDSRETAASYFLWELKKPGLLEVVNEDGKFQISDKCFSYHLPSNYIDSNMLNGKTKLKELFI